MITLEKLLERTDLCPEVRKALEEHIVRFHEEEKKLAEEHQLNLANQKLAEKALVDAERWNAIREITSGVAHDFNNSLQTILGNLELALLDENFSKQARECIEVAKNGALTATSRVRQLQRFTVKKVPKGHCPLDLNNLIEDAVFQTRPLWKDQAEKKGLRISFIKSFQEILPIDGEPGEITSVLHNLIKNAIEAMPNGGMITLETGSTNKKVFFRITDTGIGMDEETKKRIFQPFFTTKGYELGRGMGMSAVYSIIRDHGGKVAVIKTALGKGTTIEVSFPFSVKKAENIKEEIPSLEHISAQILCVDDEKVITDVFKQLLERLGHFVHTAESGEKALELLKNNKYDLLITDIGMPGMTGLQLLQEIKGRFPEMKNAIVSGWGTDISDEDKTKYEIGFVFTKPIGLSKLKKMVEEVLQSKV